LNGLRILKLRLLPEGHALPLLCSEGSALIHGPEILPATLQTVDCPDDNKLGGGLARPKEGGKTNPREEIGCCDPHLSIGGIAIVARRSKCPDVALATLKANPQEYPVAQLACT